MLFLSPSKGDAVLGVQNSSTARLLESCAGRPETTTSFLGPTVPEVWKAVMSPKTRMSGPYLGVLRMKIILL